MDAVNDFASKRGLIVLEDAAHAHGASLKGKFMGTWGRMSIFSYQMSKPLQAEGVHARAHRYPLQHRHALYQEKEWWHHPPRIADLPGSEEANRTAVALPYFTSAVPELVDQYARAFEKVWAHRDKLGRL